MDEILTGGTFVSDLGLSGEFSPSGVYLDTASYGLPPRSTSSALARVLTEWSTGQGIWEEWSLAVDRAREYFGLLMGVQSDRIMTGASYSQILSIVVSGLSAPAVVVSTDIEFTSNLFPFAVRDDLAVQIRTVPTARLEESITPDVTVVACPAVQSSTGERVDLPSIARRCTEVGARLIVDATQAAGWLPIDTNGIDALICSGYKWLLCPRGVAFGVLSPSLMSEMRPIAANWFAGEDVHHSYYGLPLRLASSARRFDISPAWFSWVGAEESLRLLSALGVRAIYRHNLALVEEFWRASGREGNASSAIVSLQIIEGVDLSSTPFRASRRDGGLRLSFHLYNSLEQAQLVGQFLAPYLR